MPRHLDTSTETQMAKIMVQYGRPSCSSWKESVRSSCGRTIMGKAIWESPIETWMGESSELGMSRSLHREEGLFLSACVDDIKLAGKKQNIGPTWKILMKDVDLGEPTSFLHHVYLGCTQRECQISQDIADNKRSMVESWISVGAMEKYQKQKPRGNLMPKPYLHGPMTWKVMQRNAWKEIANWRINYWAINYTKSQRHACMDDHQLKKEENGISWRIICCLLVKVFWNVYVFGTYRESLIFYGQWIKLARCDYKMDQMLVTNAWIEFDILHSSHMWVQTVLLCE